MYDIAINIIMIGTNCKMHSDATCYLQLTTFIQPLDVIWTRVSCRCETQLLHHLYTFQIIAASPINDYTNWMFFDNKLGLKKIMALMQFSMPLLCAKDSWWQCLGISSGLLVSRAGLVDSIAYLSSSKSLAEEYSPFFRTIRTRLFGHCFLMWPRPPQPWHITSLVRPVEAVE